MLPRDGHPTAVGEAIAAYRRIFKSLHLLAYLDVDESSRRHALACKICYGTKGERCHR